MADRPPIAPMGFDRPRTERLRVAYNAAVDAGKEQFAFDGKDLLTSYAKNLLEYLDQRFGKPG